MKFQIKTNSLNFQLKNAVIKEYPKLENLEINPSKEEQIYKSQDYYGYDTVKLNKVTNSIDENIKPENIKKDINILGITGNVEEINTTEISINPSDTEKVITPEAPYNGFSKVTVGAQSGIDPAEYFELSAKGENRACSYIKQYPSKFYDNIGGLTSYSNFFVSHTYLEKLELFDTSKCTNFSYMINGCVFIKEIPQYDTSKGTNFNYAFSTSSLETVPLLDLSSATNISSILYSNSSNLKNIGGFKDLGKAYRTTQSANYSSYTLKLSGCTNLTHESLMNIINGLYDIATAGVQPQKLQLGSTNLAKLTDEEKAIATNKGWSLS